MEKRSVGHSEGFVRAGRFFWMASRLSEVPSFGGRLLAAEIAACRGEAYHILGGSKGNCGRNVNINGSGVPINDIGAPLAFGHFSVPASRRLQVWVNQ